MRIHIQFGVDMIIYRCPKRAGLGNLVFMEAPRCNNTTKYKGENSNPLTGQPLLGPTQQETCLN